MRSQQRTWPSLDPETRTPWSCTKACPRSHTFSAHWFFIVCCCCCWVVNKEQVAQISYRLEPTVDPWTDVLVIWPGNRDPLVLHKGLLPQPHDCSPPVEQGTSYLAKRVRTSARCVNPAVEYPGQLP